MKTLTEEAQTIIYACRDSIAPGVFNPTPSRRVTLDGIEMLTGAKPSEQAMQELVSAGLLRIIGKDAYGGPLYYVVEFEA